jgi:hypothetical protein
MGREVVCASPILAIQLSRDLHPKRTDIGAGRMSLDSRASTLAKTDDRGRENATLRANKNGRASPATTS